MSFALDRDFARRFAEEWIAAWNARDLERVLRHYSDDLEMSSPFIRQIMGQAAGRLVGKTAVAAYWRKALDLIPELRFELQETLLGPDSIVLCYRGIHSNAAEILHFNAEGLVHKAAAHYGEPC